MSKILISLYPPKYNSGRNIPQKDFSTLKKQSINKGKMFLLDHFKFLLFKPI